MKKILSFMLTAIIMLAVFNGVITFAEDTFPIGNLFFELDNYKEGLPANEIELEVNGYGYLFEKMDFYITDETGLQVIGNLESATQYYLCVRFTLNRVVDTSSVSRKSVFLSGWMINDASPYDFKGMNGSYVVKFKLPTLAKGFDAINFNISGIAAGNSMGDIVVTTDTKNIIIDRIGFTKIDEKIYDVKDDEKLKYNTRYRFTIAFKVSEGYSPIGLPEEGITFSGIKEKPIFSEGISCLENWGIYLTSIYLSIPENSENTIKILNADLDGDGVVTVSDALSVLRIAAGMSDDVAVYTLKRAAVEPVKGDVDGDGHVTVADALAILRIAVGMK